MFRKAAYITVAAALIGAGVFNAFPVSAQESTSETTTITSNRQNQDMGSQMDAMMGNSDHQAMNGEQMNTQMANMMGSRNHQAMNGEQMNTQMANMMGSSNHQAMNGENTPMMNSMSGDTPASTMGRRGR